MKKQLATAASALPASLLHRLCGDDAAVFYYHVISDDDLPHIRHLYAYKGVEAFREDLRFLAANYKPVSLEDLAKHVAGEGSLPPRAIHLTFDDGFREMAETVAPILLEMGIPATFFLNTAFLDNRELCYLNLASLAVSRLPHADPSRAEAARQLLQEHDAYSGELESSILDIDWSRRQLVSGAASLLGVDAGSFLQQSSPYLTTAQVKGLISQGFAIGGHSVDHPCYGLIPVSEQLRQTTVCMDHIRESFSPPVPAFAFPHSDQGVTPGFFDKAYEQTGLNLSFGTAGPYREAERRHLQRVSLERPVWPARTIMGLQSVRMMRALASGRGTITR
jgi:peptidoglycan/xylan/chitin deacetylase (PgdA/CDA1 family)